MGSNGLTPFQSPGPPFAAIFSALAVWSISVNSILEHLKNVIDDVTAAEGTKFTNANDIVDLFGVLDNVMEDIEENDKKDESKK